ncbi:MAG: hypothetical protein NZ700_17660, partial [Gemmataceae bacterium]|nr:hypothetical protein [Gemmataceae bacterium]MDW8267413.1 hypothetical protein [Gemmataceae bacterium]
PGGPPPGRRVWLLNADLWTQTVSLPSRQVAALNPQELTAALAHEVETFSGLSAVDSVLASVPAGRHGTEQSFWVCQAASGELEEAAAAVQRAGSRLVGLCHPGGLARPITLPAEEPWQRVELWPDAIVLVHREPGQPAQVAVINADPEQGRWQGDVEAWRKKLQADCPWETRMVSGELTTFAADGTPTGILEEVKALPAWLTAWATELAGRQPAVPVLRPAPLPMSAATRRLISGSIAAASLLVCLTDHLVVSRDWAAVKAEYDALHARLNRATALANEKRKLDEEIAALTKEMGPLTTKIEQCQGSLATHRKRKAQLLALLAELRPEDLVVQQIEADSTALAVIGLSVSPQAVHAFAAQLEQKVRALAWSVPAPKVTARKQLSNGGPWDFEIRLQEVVPPLPGAERVPPRGSGSSEPVYD